MKLISIFKEVLIALFILFITCITFVTLDESKVVRVILYGDHECTHIEKSEVTGNVRYTCYGSYDTYYDSNEVKYHEGPRGGVFQIFYFLVTAVITVFIIAYFFKKYDT